MPGDDAGLLADVTRSERERELEATCRRLQRRLASKEAKTAELVEAVYQAARDAAVVVGKHPPVAAPPKDRRKGGGEAALLHLTDFQGGKVNESYNLDVCARRVMQAVEKTIKLARIQGAAHPITEAHVMLGGDLVEGVSIFPGQAFEVETGAFEQVFTVAALVEQALAALLAEFPRVVVWEVTGNHGRLGRKGDHPRADNLDRVVGELARRRLGEQPRLEWHSPDGWYQIVEIGSYRALLVHGDQIKSFGGNVPAFGIMRKATAWSSGVVEPFQDVWLAHFHQTMLFTLPNGGIVRVTGSTESGSAYAKEFVGAQSHPSQRLAFVDPRKGRVTADYILWLD